MQQHYLTHIHNLYRILYDILWTIYTWDCIAHFWTLHCRLHYLVRNNEWPASIGMYSSRGPPSHVIK